jgi:hypothetical protein
MLPVCDRPFLNGLVPLFLRGHVGPNDRHSSCSNWPSQWAERRVQSRWPPSACRPVLLHFSASSVARPYQFHQRRRSSVWTTGRFAKDAPTARWWSIWSDISRLRFCLIRRRRPSRAGSKPIRPSLLSLAIVIARLPKVDVRVRPKRSRWLIASTYTRTLVMRCSAYFNAIPPCCALQRRPRRRRRTWRVCLRRVLRRRYLLSRCQPRRRLAVVTCRHRRASSTSQRS